jgi:hypothetical protein
MYGVEVLELRSGRRIRPLGGRDHLLDRGRRQRQYLAADDFQVGTAVVGGRLLGDSGHRVSEALLAAPLAVDETAGFGSAV